MLERLISGGFMMIPLMTCSVIMVAVLIERGLAFYRNGRVDVRSLRAKILTLIEEDRIEALPGRTYAGGFIRSYADYLGLDAVQCVERFKAEIAGRTDPTLTPITVIDEDDEHRMPHGWKIMAGIVVLLVLYGAYQLAASADRMLNDKTVEPVPTMVNMPSSRFWHASTTSCTSLATSGLLLMYC